MGAAFTHASKYSAALNRPRQTKHAPSTHHRPAGPNPTGGRSTVLQPTHPGRLPASRARPCTAHNAALHRRASLRQPSQRHAAVPRTQPRVRRHRRNLPLPQPLQRPPDTTAHQRTLRRRPWSPCLAKPSAWNPPPTATTLQPRRPLAPARSACGNPALRCAPPRACWVCWPRWSSPPACCSRAGGRASGPSPGASRTSPPWLPMIVTAAGTLQM